MIFILFLFFFQLCYCSQPTTKAIRISKSFIFIFPFTMGALEWFKLIDKSNSRENEIGGATKKTFWKNWQGNNQTISNLKKEKKSQKLFNSKQTLKERFQNQFSNIINIFFELKKIKRTSKNEKKKVKKKKIQKKKILFHFPFFFLFLFFFSFFSFDVKEPWYYTFFFQTQTFCKQREKGQIRSKASFSEKKFSFFVLWKKKMKKNHKNLELLNSFFLINNGPFIFFLFFFFFLFFRTPF